MVLQRLCSKVQFCIMNDRRDFTVGDKIEGTVSFTPCSEIYLDQLQLSFQGKTSLSIDTNLTNIPVPEKQISKTFLNLIQPFGTLPCQMSGMLHVGREYRIPFEFVVPAELLPQVCEDHHRHEQVRWEHLQLPPSMGRCLHNEKQSKEYLDDMSPTVLSIIYKIRFGLAKRCRKSGILASMQEWSQPVYINTPRFERAPLLISDTSKFYRVTQDARIVKGLCRNRIGSIFAQTTTQLAVIQRENTIIRPVIINLQYKTSPRLPLLNVTDIQCQLNAITSYSDTPWSDLPDMTDPSPWDFHTDCHEHTVTLQRPSLKPLQWQTDPSDTGCYQKNAAVDTTYTATLEVPVILPKCQMYTPTFYSCLVSRTYSLNISIYLRVEEQRSRTKISLTVPLQIC
ncbi:hypothetical protein BDV25DRAFT_169874 [Aspergillus avenaceus]|uniref:Arrestin-like N-terminal domain-containing protein n=1 Tax=Aspergillus avenaceus TaxID=36643 RepID=A0A5N6U2V2_ASPAV|nr:hypothetical protein BDV25DRAFT_169874 [Aspergillus avenaceus]